MKGKKIFAGLTCMAFLAAPTATWAESTDLNVLVNDNWLSIDEEIGRAYINDDDRAMIPLRLVNTVLGYKTEWQPDGSIQITSPDGALNVELTTGSTEYTANGVSGNFETVPTLKNDRTYLPARDFTELYGSIYWEQNTRTVWISQGKALDYRVIGDQVLRADENGIHELALPEKFDIFSDGGTDLVFGERIINGESYVGLICNDNMKDPTTAPAFRSMEPIFRDEGDHLFHVMDVYPSSSYYIDGDTGYSTDGTRVGEWVNPINPYVLYCSGINAPDSMGQIIRWKMDFVINDCVLDMENGVLTATSPDGTVHEIGDLLQYPSSLDGVHWDK